ncbi:dihydrofolate reductase [Puniceibacterium confluentis]|uniref:dihydrofolate reductase n=1 Tax=Puniceibacterium confluentis TaxID=1958944 RepID=UPI0011B75AAB|nr:dihydrofolate reductase [Puniceibacterium confluentis]
MISLIVARARNGAIGRDGTIPWHVPEDLKFFQRETLGGALIMGRNTWESLPVKPLSKRLNIVVSSNPDASENVVPSVKAAVEMALERGYTRIYGIGGAGIYKEMLPLAHRLLITEVDLEVPDADTFFPNVDLTDWAAHIAIPLRSASPECQLREYLRRG